MERVKISVNNFLQFAPIEQSYTFPENGILLILGEKEDGGSNGAGKSTLLEAFLWVFKGKTVKGYTADQVINRNHPDTPASVSIEFYKGKNKYLIRRERRIGKSILKFEVNGKDISNQKIDTTQKQIDEVYNYTFDTITKSIVCSADQDLPHFLRLKDVGRKAVIENLIFGPEFRLIAEKAKKERKAIKDTIDPIEKEYIALESLIKGKIETLKEYSKGRDKDKKELEEEIEVLKKVDVEEQRNLYDYHQKAFKWNNYTGQYKTNRNNLQKDLDFYEKQDVEKLNRKAGLLEKSLVFEAAENTAKGKNEGIEVSIKEFRKNIDRLTEEYKTHQKDFTKLEEAICHTCGQNLNSEKAEELRKEYQQKGDKIKSDLSANIDMENHYKEQIVAVMKNLEKELEGKEENDEALKELKDIDVMSRYEIGKIDSSIKEKKEALEALKKDFDKEIEPLLADVKEAETKIKEIVTPEVSEERLESIEKDIADKTSKLLGLTNNEFYDSQKKEIDIEMSKFQSIKKNYNSLKEELGYYDFIVTSLGNGDDCFKNYYFESIIPYINETATNYLKRFFEKDNISIELDKGLKETITRDDIEETYNMLSFGEKARANFAMLLTFNELARLNMKDDSNILWLDEILDSAVDEPGLGKFVETTQEMSKDMLILIMSHKAEMKEKFPDSLLIKKINGDSYLESYANAS
jgi:DNA repair exonuclease SbcCD ATPase subunit